MFEHILHVISRARERGGGRGKQQQRIITRNTRAARHLNTCQRTKQHTHSHNTTRPAARQLIIILHDARVATGVVVVVSGNSVNVVRGSSAYACRVCRALVQCGKHDVFAPGVELNGREIKTHTCSQSPMKNGERIARSTENTVNKLSARKDRLTEMHAQQTLSTHPLRRCRRCR